jgi:hypothetical protein
MYVCDAVKILIKFVNLFSDSKSMILVGKFIFGLFGMLFKKFMSN